MRKLPVKILALLIFSQPFESFFYCTSHEQLRTTISQRVSGRSLWKWFTNWWFDKKSGATDAFFVLRDKKSPLYSRCWHFDMSSKTKLHSSFERSRWTSFLQLTHTLVSFHCLGSWKQTVLDHQNNGKATCQNTRPPSKKSSQRKRQMKTAAIQFSSVVYPMLTFRSFSYFWCGHSTIYPSIAYLRN